jgi:hypothetical protein
VTSHPSADGPEPERAEAEPPEDDGWNPDPDAPPTVEGRIAQALEELRALLRSTVLAAVVATLALAGVDLARGQGFALSSGFALGASAATINLWLLGSGIVALVRGERRDVVRALVVLGGAFTGLLALCAWVLAARRGWTVGFALGLSLPALGGLLYARRLVRRRG